MIFSKERVCNFSPSPLSVFSICWRKDIPSIKLKSLVLHFKLILFSVDFLKLCIREEIHIPKGAPSGSAEIIFLDFTIKVKILGFNYRQKGA